MSGIVRDFSLSSVEHLKNIIKQNVDEDNELFLVDWVKDWFMDDLDINDYINDIDTYHAKMVDKYDISTKKFEQILNKVHAVDISYADRFNSIYEGLSSFNALIMNVTALIDPSAVTLDQNAYEELLSGIESVHAENMEIINKAIKNDDAELDDALREVPWYETVLDFVAGAGVELVKNNIEGLFFIPFKILDGIFDEDRYSTFCDNLDGLEEQYILPHIGNKQAYYFGRATGDVITIVEGAYGMVKGIATIAGGITITGGGTALSATGIGSIIGAPAIAVSVPVVLAGAGELALAGGIAYTGYSNFDDNIMKASTNDVKDITDKQSALDNSLNNTPTRVNYGEQYRRVNGKKALKPDIEYVSKEGYRYVTDSEGRISNVNGKLKPGKAKRNQYAQSHVGKGDGRLDTDDGGHLIASIFEGSGDIDNLVPMDYRLNRGDWKSMENTWARALENGKSVEVNIEPIYSDLSKRPIAFEVEYKIQGENWVFREFTN